jgi:hypothetical protein
LPPFFNLAPQGPAGRLHGGAPLPLRLGVNQVSEPLGLREVKSAIEQGATSELAGPCLAQTLDGRQFGEQACNDRTAPMEVELDERLAGSRLRSREAQQQRFIDK